MKFDGFTAMPKPFRAAALALPIAFGLTAPAAAEPSFLLTDTVALSPGISTSFYVLDVFEDAGTNPRFTGVTFSDTTYIDSVNSGFPGDESGTFWVQVLTNDELNALSPKPGNPFTFTADVTMTNNDGDTVSGTATFEVTYVQTSDAGSGVPSGTAPTIKADLTISAPAGGSITVHADQLFDNPGTFPRITDAVFTTTDYYVGTELRNDGLLVVAVKPSEVLNAMVSTPPSPLEVDVTVTMTNNEGQTATGTFTLETAY